MGKVGRAGSSCVQGRGSGLRDTEGTQWASDGGLLEIVSHVTKQRSPLRHLAHPGDISREAQLLRHITAQARELGPRVKHLCDHRVLELLEELGECCMCVCVCSMCVCTHTCVHMCHWQCGLNQ